jgi:hypothetical protein
VRPFARLALVGLGAAFLGGAGTARAQTMLDQEQRLIELHSLLMAIPSLEAPGALRAGQASLGLELVTIPTIDGATGGKTQITASDRTRVFPRPRLALGLPAPGDLRFFAGAAYIPPVEINRVSSHLAAAEAGVAWIRDWLVIGGRAQVVSARSRSPVTDPSTRDTLRTTILGTELSVGARLGAGSGTVTPYLGAGVTRVDGRFTVSSDAAVLTSRTTTPSLSAGVRLFSGRRFEGVGELVAYPDRMVHASFKIAWVPQLGSIGSER